MRRVLLVVGRVLLLLIIWGLAGAVSVRAVAQAVTHRRMLRETAVLQQEYDALLEQYAATLAEGQRLSSDHDYQLELLKQEFGYTAPDETPIVILRQDDAAKADSQ